MAKGFYELNIWKKGYALLMEIYKITTTFPKEEKYGLSRQMRDSANSVISNIQKHTVDITLPIKQEFFIHLVENVKRQEVT